MKNVARERHNFLCKTTHEKENEKKEEKYSEIPNESWEQNYTSEKKKTSVAYPSRAPDV